MDCRRRWWDPPEALMWVAVPWRLGERSQKMCMKHLERCGSLECRECPWDSTGHGQRKTWEGKQPNSPIYLCHFPVCPSALAYFVTSPVKSASSLMQRKNFCCCVFYDGYEPEPGGVQHCSKAIGLVSEWLNEGVGETPFT